MSLLTIETDTERHFISAVQSQLRARVEATSSNAVAELLEIHPEGVRSLLLKEWPLQKAFRVADALNVDFASLLRR